MEYRYPLPSPRFTEYQHFEPRAFATRKRTTPTAMASSNNVPSSKGDVPQISPEGSGHVDAEINLLASECPKGDHVQDPVMDATATLGRCMNAKRTFVRLHDFQDVACKLAESDPETEAHQEELRNLKTRLEKTVKHAKARVGL
ncbi:hypothetical protein QFC22_006153 [Naganishia vaughanmartiniae]|uniref:Uncharacterized protein n=1 Tax=Naganishia vaughanmartiniae TaxID=1424756 RepID=A0ACC2WR83_9TREE|nr:hypothetical protein QFC22_006153 [Naganishia vaughanmartiniae]